MKSNIDSQDRLHPAGSRFSKGHKGYCGNSYAMWAKRSFRNRETPDPHVVKGILYSRQIFRIWGRSNGWKRTSLTSIWISAVHITDSISAIRIHRFETSTDSRGISLVSDLYAGWLPRHRRDPSRKQEMAKFLVLLASLLLVLLSTLAHSESPNRNVSSAFEELKGNGFPVGLLPTNVVGYTLNRSSGVFTVELDGRCQITLPPDSYLAAYSSTITGRLRNRSIGGLDGIRVRAFFRWWSITGIRSSGDDLVFEVGITSAKYAARNFDESPQCEGRKASF